MNPLYPGAQPPMMPQPQMNRNALLQAMANPPAFVRRMIPNLPPQIANDPNQILQWMLQNGSTTPQEIQYVSNSAPPIPNVSNFTPRF